MRIGIAQLKTTVGDLAGNRDQIIAAYRRLVEAGAELVICPELTITGYPPRDLLLRPRFGDAAESALLEVAAATGAIPLLVGALDRNPDPAGRPFFNAAALCYDRVVQGFARKCVLPNIDGINEASYFEPYDRPTVFVIGGKRVAVLIGEDIRADEPTSGRRSDAIDPVPALSALRSVDLVVNLAAGPWHMGESSLREELIVETAKRLNAPLVFANAVGESEGLNLDGRSMVTRRDGSVQITFAAFEATEGVVPVDEASV